MRLNALLRCNRHKRLGLSHAEISFSCQQQIANEALLGDIIPLLSDEIIAEYREVLAREKFSFNKDAVDIIIDGIIERGIFIDVLPVEEIV